MTLFLTLTAYGLWGMAISCVGAAGLTALMRDKWLHAVVFGVLAIVMSAALVAFVESGR